MQQSCMDLFCTGDRLGKQAFQIGLSCKEFTSFHDVNLRILILWGACRFRFHSLSPEKEEGDAYRIALSHYEKENMGSFRHLACLFVRMVI
jgi:hypothetical protein